MTVGIIGDGPAATAVEATLDEVDLQRRAIELTDIGTTELAVVVGEAGDPIFELANEQALADEACWIAVELGGVGGLPVVDTAVSAFGPESACYECLSGRVGANLDRQSTGERSPSAHARHFAGTVAGRQVARYLVDEAAVFGTVVTAPFTRRSLLPLPNCTCDDGSRGALDHNYVERDLSDALERAERGVDDLLGIVQEVGEAESFPLPYYLARSCDTAGFSDASAARDAAGVAVDWNTAFMKALGEAFERYCAGVYRESTFEYATPADLSNAVGPARFATTDEPSPDEEIPWVAGESLATGESVSLPAEFVFHPPPARQYHAPVTTGLGLGNSSVEAILAGLYEVLERDAMMLSWYSTFDPLGLDVEDETFQTMVARARSEGLTVRPLLLTQDVDVPVVGVAVTRGEWPRLAFGTGADLDVVDAARSALAEALQNWTELRGMGPDDAADAMGAIGRYADDPGPAGEFVDATATVPAESVGPSTVPTGEAELDAVLDRLADVSLDAYAVGLTTRDVETLGFEAARTVLPAAQPLTFGSHSFGERARTVPADLGFEPRLDRDHHPFP